MRDKDHCPQGQEIHSAVLKGDELKAFREEEARHNAEWKEDDEEFGRLMDDYYRSKGYIVIKPSTPHGVTVVKLPDSKESDKDSE